MYNYTDKIRICSECNIEFIGAKSGRLPKVLLCPECKKEKMEVVCLICGTEMKNGKKYCSKSCITKASWQNEEYRKKRSEQSKQLWQNEEHRNNVSEKCKLFWSAPEMKKRLQEIRKESWTDERREQFSATRKEMWKNSEYREMMINGIVGVWDRPGEKERRSIISSEANNRPEVKEKMSRALKKVWALPGVREQRSLIAKEVNNRPEVKEKISNAMISYWAIPENAIRHSLNMYKFKEYVLPSGKMVKVQGFEPQVLDEIFSKYSEDDVEIRKFVRYEFDGKMRNHYPDIYIKSENKIIDVKSHFTFHKHVEKNIAKQKSLIEQGFIYEFRIPDDLLLEEKLNNFMFNI